MSSSQALSVAARRRWPIEEKRRIVELTHRKGANIGNLAQQFGIHSTTLSAWRNLYRDGRLEVGDSVVSHKASIAKLIPVTVTLPTRIPLTHPSKSTIHISFTSGTSVRIEVDVLRFADLGALIATMQ